MCFAGLHTARWRRVCGADVWARDSHRTPPPGTAAANSRPVECVILYYYYNGRLCVCYVYTLLYIYIYIKYIICALIFIYFIIYKTFHSKTPNFISNIFLLSIFLRFSFSRYLPVVAYSFIKTYDFLLIVSFVIWAVHTAYQWLPIVSRRPLIYVLISSAILRLFCLKHISL